MRFSIARYWRERKSYYRLTGTKCLRCGRINYPPSKVCRYCGSRELEEVDLLGPAKLLSWSIVYSAPEGFEEYRPLIIAMVELKETGVRLLTRITDADPEELKPGMILEPVLRRLGEDGIAGLVKYGICFRPPVKGASGSE